jgi:hypothetical protein
MSGRSLVVVVFFASQLTVVIRSSGRREWANVAADVIRDVAARLLVPGSPWPAVEYTRLREVCKTWRKNIDDPRCVCSLDIRFRPRGWTPIHDPPPVSGCRLRHVSGVRTYVKLDALSTNYAFGVADGLLVVRDKRRADVVRLLNPFTGVLTEFPPITEVRALDGSEPKPGLVDALKLHFSDYRHTVFRNFAGTDDLTSPPSLVFGVVNDRSYDVVYARPGDHHWVSVHHLTGISLSSDVRRIKLSLIPPPGTCSQKTTIIYLYRMGII